MSNWNKKHFSIYNSEEKQMLGLLKELGDQTNFNTVKAEEMEEDYNNKLNNKTDINGDHKGSWQGLNKPTMSEEGMRATVEKIIEQDIPLIIKDIAKRNYFYSPEMFGETGTNNDTKVIQDMFDFIAENNLEGANIKFISKKYVFDEVIIKTPNLNISSNGIIDGTFIVQSVENLDVNSFNIISMNVVFNGVTFKSDNRRENAIIIKRLRDCTIINCSFENYKCAIYGDSEPNFKWQRTSRVKILNNIFKRCGNCIKTFQTIQDESDTLWTYMQHGDYTISGNYFYCSYDNISDTPVILNGQDGLILKGNFFFCGNRQIGRGVEVNDSNFTIIEGNNFFETAFEGIYLTKIRNLNICNNTFAWCGQKAPKKTIVVKGHGKYVSTRVNINNNIIEKTSDTAIYIDGDVTRIKVSNNNISGVGLNYDYFDSSLIPSCYDIMINTSSAIESETEFYCDVIVNDNYGDKGVNCGRGVLINNYNHNYIKNKAFFGNLKYGLTVNGVVDFYQFSKLNQFNPSYPYIFKEWNGTISNITNANLNQIIVLISGSSTLKIKNDVSGDGMIKTKSKDDVVLERGQSMTLMKTDTYWIEI